MCLIGGRVPVDGITIIQTLSQDSPGVTTVFYVLACVGVLFCLGCLLLNFIYRKHRLVSKKAGDLLTNRAKRKSQLSQQSQSQQIDELSRGRMTLSMMAISTISYLVPLPILFLFSHGKSTSAVFTKT